ncbi:hypothetical protein Agabi119p4_884 [Agaricus bisporus var. burnettii]|uniref:Uncharacterized protein n=1 Tax=Agaricus bisporus var. burnettii TaxID=192524 RepID=A0A8H7KLK3_AGABI|nr:hypothetical protein Agabi119p4_884 [Agaricus bisporus var. burnettii]
MMRRKRSYPSACTLAWKESEPDGNIQGISEAVTTPHFPAGSVAIEIITHPLSGELKSKLTWPTEKGRKNRCSGSFSSMLPYVAVAIISRQAGNHPSYVFYLALLGARLWRK